MFPSHLLRPGIEIPITFVLLSRLSFFLQATVCHLLFALQLAGIGACLHKLLLPLLLQTFLIELEIPASVRPVGGHWVPTSSSGTSIKGYVGSSCYGSTDVSRRSTCCIKYSYKLFLIQLALLSSCSLHRLLHVLQGIVELLSIIVPQPFQFSLDQFKLTRMRTGSSSKQRTSNSFCSIPAFSLSLRARASAKFEARASIYGPC